MLLFMSIEWDPITGHKSSLKSCRNILDRVSQKSRNPTQTIEDPGLNVSFDAPAILDIAFPPQNLVRWLSGRKRRFAKALYPKRVPRVRIPASPVHS